MITLLDTITPNSLAGTPISDAYAGYVGGHWPDYNQIRSQYPNHHYTSIAIAPGEVADFCDCEGGDFTPAQVIPWLKEMHVRGIWRPGVYASASTLATLLPTIARSLPRALYRIWGADWNGVRNVPAGWDSHQWADRGPHGENYDQSVCLDTFFPSHRPPPPPLVKGTLTAHLEYDPAHRRWSLSDHTTVTGA